MLILMLWVYRARASLDLSDVRGAELCGFCTSKYCDWERFNEGVDYIIPLAVIFGDVLAVRSVSLNCG